LERLDALVAKLPIVSTRSGLARAALRIGLSAVEQDATVLVRQSLPQHGGRRKGAGRPSRTKAKPAPPQDLRARLERATNEEWTTAKALAEAIGVAPSTLSRWRGGRGGPLAEWHHEPLAKELAKLEKRHG